LSLFTFCFSRFWRSHSSSAARDLLSTGDILGNPFGVYVTSTQHFVSITRTCTATPRLPSQLTFVVYYCPLLVALTAPRLRSIFACSSFADLLDDSSTIVCKRLSNNCLQPHHPGIVYLEWSSIPFSQYDRSKAASVGQQRPGDQQG
jgi:hypothetical protein